MSDQSKSTEELVAELRQYEAGLSHSASAVEESPVPAPARKTLRDELAELATGPFDLERERRKIAVASAIAAGAE